MNLTHGFAQTGAGIVSAPSDRGRRIQKGARGMMWCVPELIGISIRRGHYDLLPIEIGSVTAKP